jgi:hypothetical protein
LGLDTVVAKEVVPGTGPDGFFDPDGVNNIGMKLADGILGQIMRFESEENFKSFVGTVVGYQPARGFVDEEYENQHGDQQDTLQGARDTPGVAALMRTEGVIDPVYQSDSKVEGR